MKIPSKLFEGRTVKVEPSFSTLKSLGAGERKQLARELAEARGIKEKSAARNLQRYITEGKQKRRQGGAPLPADLSEAVKKNFPDKLIKTEKPSGSVKVEFIGELKVSGKEKGRKRSITHAIDLDTLREMKEAESVERQQEIFFNAYGLDGENVTVVTQKKFRIVG